MSRGALGGGLARAGCVALVTGVVLLACSADDVETPTYEIGLFPKVAYSGFNARAAGAFRVLLATSAARPVWSVADPGIATISPTDKAPTLPGVDVRDLRFALLTTSGVGETTVTVRDGDVAVTSKVVVKGYSDDQIALGKTRYEAGSSDPARPPCAQCHQSATGVDHSPLKMAGYDDPTILGVIQEATYPPTASGEPTTSAYAPKGPLSLTTHRWNLTDPEKDAILAHLRALPLGGL